MKRSEAGTAGREDRRTLESRVRLVYEKPEIVDRGKLVEVALGGSPGTGDSGGGVLVENPLV